MLLAQVEDPVRVIVEQSSGGWFSTWGPLVGVVVGALLGSVGQLLASTLSHKRGLDRERQEWRRSIYVETLDALWNHQSVILDHQVQDRGERDSPATTSQERLRHAEQRAENAKAADLTHTAVVACMTRLSLYAPAAVYDAATQVSRALNGVDRTADGGWGDTSRHLAELIAAMRKDLGVNTPLSKNLDL